MIPYDMCFEAFKRILSRCDLNGATYGGSLSWKCGYWLLEPVPAGTKPPNEARDVVERDSFAMTRVQCFDSGMQTSQLTEVKTAIELYCGQVSDKPYTKVLRP